MYPMTSEPASRYFFKLLSEFKTELEKYEGVCVGVVVKDKIATSHSHADTKVSKGI